MCIVSYVSCFLPANSLLLKDFSNLDVCHVGFRIVI